MLQQKRQQYRKAIRRKELDKYFKQRRQEVFRQKTYQQYIQELKESQLYINIQQAIKDFYFSINQFNCPQALYSLQQIINCLRQNQIYSSISIFLVASYFGESVKKIIKNQQKFNLQTQTWSNISLQFQKNLLRNIFQIVLQMSYTTVSEQPLTNLVSAIWTIFDQDLTFFSGDNKQYWFDLVFKWIVTMLENKNKTVLQVLKNLGLGQHLVKIVKYQIDKMHINGQIQLIKIIFLYLQLQKSTSSASSNMINGIAILGSQSNQKQFLFAFCMHMIDQKYNQESLKNAIGSSILILQTNQYLANSMQQKSVFQVCELLLHVDRQFESQVIELVDEIIYYSPSIVIPLLQKMYIIDKIFIILQRQQKIGDQLTKTFCHICCHILSNLTYLDKEVHTKQKQAKTKKQLVYNQRLLSQLCQHPIWQFAYNNILTYSPLIEMVTVFEYYFQVLPRRQTMKIMQNYLASVGMLELNYLQKSYIESIKRTIYRVYFIFDDFHQEDYEQKLKSWIEINGLKHLVEEVMEIQYPEQNDLL